MNCINRILWVLVVCVFVLSAGNEIALNANPGDACSLLTQKQASAALGVMVESGQRSVSNDPKICGWTEPNTTPLTAKRIVLSIGTADTFNLGKTPLQEVTKTAVSGLGDDAYYVTAAVEGTTLNVRKGSQAFSLGVMGHEFSTDQVKAMEKTLAQQVLAGF